MLNEEDRKTSWTHFGREEKGFLVAVAVLLIFLVLYIGRGDGNASYLQEEGVCSSCEQW